MAMLSGAARRRSAASARRTDAPAASLTALAHGCAEVAVAGVRVRATAEGGLWIAEAGALVVSDMHLEKGSAFARRGQMLPPYDTRTTLARLEALIAAYAPRMVISLGDSFHDVDAPARMHGTDAARLAALVGAVEWVWIVGNHDPDLPPALGGVRREAITLGALTLRHEPRAGDAPGEIAGHLHPCAKVAARGRSVRARCFATDGRRLVMPAFGAYAGGLNLCDRAFAPVFPKGAMALMAARGRVWPAPAHRLLPDSG
jgi:hypothetical protein